MKIEHCERCGEDWCYRGKGRAIRCGKCKSPYWDRERVNEATTQKSGSGRHGEVDGGDVRGQEFRGDRGNRVADIGNRDRSNDDERRTEDGNRLAGKEVGGDAEAVNLCRSCEDPLVSSGGKLYCANQACGDRGIEQKVRRGR